MDAIKAEHLTKKYKDLTVVDGLDLAVREGELFSLLGVNGAGKTTTIKMLSCLTKPTGGDAYLLGNSIVSNTAEVKKSIGVSPQETAIAPNLTVRENLEFMCGLHGFSREKRKQKTADLVERLGLAQVLGKKAEKLSGGYQRRLSIAMALIGEPKILFLDEPTSSIDPLARRLFWRSINRLADEGKAIIVTTHFMEEAEYCTRIAIQDRGHMLALGSPKEVKAVAGLPETANMNEAFIKIVKAYGEAGAADD